MHESDEIGIEIEADSEVCDLRPADKVSLKFVQIDDPKRIIGALVGMINEGIVGGNGDCCAGEDNGAAKVGNG